MRPGSSLHTRERADRAQRAGRPREALAHYWQLLESVKATRAHYDSWLDGAVRAYWRSTERGRPATCSSDCGATRRRSATFLRPSGRSSGRSARRSWGITATRPAFCRRAAVRSWRRSSSRRRAPARRRASSGSACSPIRAPGRAPLRDGARPLQPGRGAVAHRRSPRRRARLLGGAAPARDGGRRLREPRGAGARLRLLQRSAPPRQGDRLVRERLERATSTRFACWRPRTSCWRCSTTTIF